MKKPSPAAPAFTRRNLPMLLLQARECVIRRFRPVLKAHGLTEQQWRILRVLAERGPTEPRELVALCAISSPSLAGILARMDDLGLVSRQRMDSDQRRVILTTTADSRALAASIAPKVDAVYREIEKALGLDVTGHLYGTLDEVITVLGEGPGGTNGAEVG